MPSIADAVPEFPDETQADVGEPPPRAAGEMKPLPTSDGELAWLPLSALRRDSELVSGSDVFARVRWQSAFQALATGETADGFWRFKLEGFLLRQWINIYASGEERPLAVFQAQPSLNGVLEFADGRAYHWDSNFWLTKWIWSDENGLELMRVQRHLTFRTEGSVVLVPEALPQPDVPLLTVLGWYLIQIVTDLRVG